MSIEWFDLDRVVRVGNPWHGAIQGTTLITGAGGVSVAVVGGAAAKPDTHLVEFPGLAAPVNSAEELAAGHELKNHAVLFDVARRYSVKSSLGIGSHRHVYLTADRTHYHIDLVAGNVSGAVGEGATWNLPFRLDAIKASGGALGSPEVIVPTENLSITGFGGGSGYYAQLSNFSPDGTKLAICIHKFPTSGAASSLDTRRSLGVAGVWEVVLSGGSKDVAPTAVLSLVKNSADCHLITNSSPAEYVSDIGYSVTGSGEGTATPLPSPPNPAGLVSLSIWQEWTINLDKVAYTPHSVDYRVLGAAYNTANALCVFAMEIDDVVSISDEYSGPDDDEVVRFDADIEAYASDHSIVTRVISQTSVHVRVYVTSLITTRYRLKSDSTTLYELVRTAASEGVDGAGSGKDGYLEIFMTHSPPLYLWQAIGGDPVYTFDGNVVTAFPAVSARMTSNNTAAMFCDTEAYKIVAPSGIVGNRQTLSLDANGLPWCSWQPKTNALAVTPGYSWC